MPPSERWAVGRLGPAHSATDSPRSAGAWRGSTTYMGRPRPSVTPRANGHGELPTALLRFVLIVSSPGILLGSLVGGMMAGLMHGWQMWCELWQEAAWQQQIQDTDDLP